MVENLLAMQETWVWSLGREDALEKGKASHSSILAWRIPWTGYNPWDHEESDTIEQLPHFQTSVMSWPQGLCRNYLAFVNFRLFIDKIWYIV